jgi:hypothetical protein
MTGILITFNIASMVVLGYVFYHGYQIGMDVKMSTHILMALIATGFCVFSHSMTMMYFAATGRMIRQAVEQANLDPKYVAETKGYRSKIFRLAAIAMIVVMTHTILGGGAHTKMFPIRVHEILAIFTLILNGYAVVMEVRYLILNHLLGHHVARLFEKKAS